MHLSQNGGKGALQIQVQPCHTSMSWILCHLDQHYELGCAVI